MSPIRKVSREDAEKRNAEREAQRQQEQEASTDRRQSQERLGDGFNGGLAYRQREANIIRLKHDPVLSRRLGVEHEGTQSFSLKTRYPGLLAGSGYPHPKAREDNNDFQLGFFFDHTSGMPVIPGSSIKGVLRSPFRRLYDSQTGDSAVALLNDAAGLKEENQKKDVTFWQDVERLIFAGIDAEGEMILRRERTVFHDAVIAGTDNDRGYILADDYITHHPGSFDEPNPVRFLKVRSGVTFRFTFQPGRAVEGIDTVKLFENIILLLGLGAKTAHGYGHFDTVDNGSSEVA